MKRWFSVRTTVIVRIWT